MAPTTPAAASKSERREKRRGTRPYLGSLPQSSLATQAAVWSSSSPPAGGVSVIAFQSGGFEPEQVLDEEVVALARGDRAAGAVVGARDEDQLELLAGANERVDDLHASTPGSTLVSISGTTSCIRPFRFFALSTFDDAA